LGKAFPARKVCPAAMALMDWMAAMVKKVLQDAKVPPARVALQARKVSGVRRVRRVRPAQLDRKVCAVTMALFKSGFKTKIQKPQIRQLWLRERFG
jgi:hypothetical protein